MFDALSEPYLHDALTHLRSNVPGDATFAATVSTLLKALVEDELRGRVGVAAGEDAAEQIDKPGYVPPDEEAPRKRRPYA